MELCVSNVLAVRNGMYMFKISGWTILEIIVKLSIVLLLLISKKTDASLEDQANLDINGMEVNAIIAQVNVLQEQHGAV